VKNIEKKATSVIVYKDSEKGELHHLTTLCLLFWSATQIEVDSNLFFIFFKLF
jgi:hypothetical protein